MERVRELRSPRIPQSHPYGLPLSGCHCFGLIDMLPQLAMEGFLTVLSEV